MQGYMNHTPSLALGKYERDIARLLWTQGPLSRRDVAEQTGIHPTLVGNAASELIRLGIARDASASLQSGPVGGRPRLPVEIDPQSRHVIGLAVSPHSAEVVRSNLCGHPIGTSLCTKAALSGEALIKAAAKLLSQYRDDQTLCIGVSVPGFIDLPGRKLLLSAVAPDSHDLPLDLIYEKSDGLPVMLNNDMHALSARWLLAHRAPTDEDVLLAWIGDGSIGASLLVEGKPNRGCVTGANELGHVGTGLTTPRCFCGRTGCLERVFSTEFIQSVVKTKREADLDLGAELAKRGDCAGVTGVLAASLANAANLFRPHRVVIASNYARFGAFTSRLGRELNAGLLPGLAGKVRLDWWDQATATSAETAAWLALAAIYHN